MNVLDSRVLKETCAAVKELNTLLKDMSALLEALIEDLENLPDDAPIDGSTVDCVATGIVFTATDAIVARTVRLFPGVQAMFDNDNNNN